MKLITTQLEDNHNLFFFGDRHGDSVLSSKRAWECFVDTINSKFEGCKNNYGAEGGDDIEAIMVDDKRFSEEKLTEDLPLLQMKKAVKDRETIKHRLFYKLEGNHERKLWRFGNIMEEMCKELGVIYGTYTAKLTVLNKKGGLMYKTYDTHGRKGINSTADDPQRRQTNLELTLKRHLKFKAGDCAVMIKHHTHKLLSCAPVSELYLTDDGENIKQGYTGWGQSETYIHPDARWYGNAGSFLRLFGKDISGYAELAEYDPVEMGYLVLIVRDREIVELKSVRFVL